jgi:hypothetical protein
VLAAGHSRARGGLKSFPSGIKLDRIGEAVIDKMQGFGAVHPDHGWVFSGTE